MVNNKENDLRKRIQQLLKECGKTINSIATDKSEQRTLNRQINEDTTISSNTIYRLIDVFPDCSLEWLLTGNGEMIKTEEAKLPRTNQIETHNNDPLVNRLLDTIEKKDLKIEELLKENARLGEQFRLIEAKKTDSRSVTGSISTRENLSRTSQRATSVGVHLEE
jgi:hypothetical protein